MGGTPAKKYLMMLFRFQATPLPILVLSVIASGNVAFATETDQFTTPRTPLYDIGPKLSRKVVEIIESDRTGRDPDVVLSEWVGHNFVTSRLVRWVKSIRVAEGPVTFLPIAPTSIYRLALAPAPATFLFDSPTVRVHGYYLGTDKIDHFFQQGHKYFVLVQKNMDRGAGEREAIAAAVAYGVKQEHGYFGTLATGVYSNGDLAANYAGMKFYLNLRRPVTIGGEVWPPLFERSGEGWRLRPGIDPDRVLEPFFSNHFDESLNPSRYGWNRRSIRSAVRNRCDRWMEFYADRLELVAPSGRSFATTWFGEEYGHWLPPAEETSIATECDAVPLRPVKRSLAGTF